MSISTKQFLKNDFYLYITSRADISALTDINKSDELGIIHDSSKLTVLLKYVIITWKKNICEYISKYANISEFLDIIILTALSFVALSY